MSNARDKANIPSLNFSSTGIDDNATSTAITIDSSQRVGIGTSSPGKILDIRSADPIIQTVDTGDSDAVTRIDGNAGWLQFRADNNNTLSGTNITFNIDGSEKMRIKDSGNVGIGTTSPAVKLDVRTAAGTAAQQNIYTGSNAASASLQFGQIGAVSWDIGLTATSGHFLIGGLGGGVAEAYRINRTGISVDYHAWSTNGSERMRITSTGNVGIGETAPLGKLHVKSADSGASVNSVVDELVLEGSGRSGMTILSGSSSIGAIAFGDSGSSTVASINYDHSDNNLNFFTNSAERMRIDSSGTFYLNTTSSPTANGAGAGSIGQLVTSGDAWNMKHTVNGATMVNMWQTGVNGCAAFNFHKGNSQTGVGNISLTTSGVSYNSSSDYRLKENVDYNFDATSRLKQLKPARFNFIADANTTVDGFLAHEVSSIVPEAITGEKDAVDENGNPEYQGIDQSKLVPLLVKTIQELEARITELENK